MPLSVEEAASRLGTTPSRVRALLASDHLEGAKIGRTWAVDAASVETRIRDLRLRGSRAGRPMSPRVAWSVAMLCDDPAADTPLTQPERSRALARLRSVPVADAGVIYSWMARRASTTRLFKIASRDLDAITQAEGVIRTGISSSTEYNLDITPRSEAHIYAATHRVEAQLIKDYWLIESADGNLTVSVPAAPLPPLRVAPRIMCAADLVDRSSDTRTVRVASTLISDTLTAIST